MNRQQALDLLYDMKRIWTLVVADKLAHDAGISAFDTWTKWEKHWGFEEGEIASGHAIKEY